MKLNPSLGKGGRKIQVNVYFYCRFCRISCTLERVSEGTIHMVAGRALEKCAVHDWWVQHENPIKGVQSV